MSKNEFSVIKINSRQFVVTEGSSIKIDRISSGTQIEVLLHSKDSEVLLGEPVLADYGVELLIIEDKDDKKISVGRYKSKSRYKKVKGHRQPISIVKVVKLGKAVKSAVLTSMPKLDKVPSVEKKTKKVSSKLVKKAK